MVGGGGYPWRAVNCWQGGRDYITGRNSRWSTFLQNQGVGWRLRVVCSVMSQVDYLDVEFDCTCQTRRKVDAVKRMEGLWSCKVPRYLPGKPDTAHIVPRYPGPSKIGACRPADGAS